MLDYSPLTVADLVNQVTAVRYRIELKVGAEAPSQLFDNTGLDAWTSATVPVTWSKVEWGSSTVNRESTVKHGGLYAARMDVDAGNYGVGILQELLTAVSGGEYSLSCWYKTESGKTIGLSCSVYVGDWGTSYYLQSDGSWKLVSEEGASYYYATVTNTEWTNNAVSFTLPPAIVSNYLIWEVRNVSAADSSYYIDDVELMGPKADNEWADLTALVGENYLATVSTTPSGAGRDPAPMTGRWSATFDNPGGIFNPFHPTSAYKDYFRIGREVRISTGLEVSGTTTWIQRLQGFMDEPDIQGESLSVSGCDYMKLLADKKLSSPWTHWGAHEHFTSIATGGAGSELYDEGDACEIGAGEGNNVTPWTVGASGGAVASVAGDSSTFALQFTRDAPGPTEQYANDSNIFTLVAGQQYIITFQGQIMAGENYARLLAYETIGGAASYLGEVTIPWSDGVENACQFTVTAKSSSALQLRVSTGGKYAAVGDAVRVDNISVKTYDPTTWNKYELSAACTGVYLVTLDGELVAHGDEDSDSLTSSKGGGWHYEDTGATKILRFSEKMQVAAGLDIAVYYFTAQALDDVAADLAVAAGIYSTRALARADMDLVPTGISLDRVWFKAAGETKDVSALDAMKLLCERANYRFWFSAGNTPTFRPAATLAATPDFTFSLARDVATPSLHQDHKAVRNRVVINGEEQSVEPGTAEKPIRLTGEALDQDLIDRDGEMTWTIDNELFQDTDSIADTAAALLADHKTPKWYLDVPIPYCAIPFEVGDSITLQVPLSPSVSVEKKAIVRGLELDLGGTTLSCEISEGYPAVAKLPDRGAHEWQGTIAPPVSVALPDRGAHEWQGA